MASFSCQRCRQPILLSSTLSSSTQHASSSSASDPHHHKNNTPSPSVSTSMSLTQSTYDLMQSQAFLVRHVPRRGAAKEGGSGAASKRGARQKGLLGGLAAAATLSSTSSTKGSDRNRERDEAKINLTLTSLASPSSSSKPKPGGGGREEERDVESVREALRRSAGEKRERGRGKSLGSGNGEVLGHAERKSSKSTFEATPSMEDKKDVGDAAAKAVNPSSSSTPASTSGVPPPSATPASSAPVPNSLSSRLSLTTSLFSLLSSTASKSRSALAIDHPLCKECTDLLLEIMNAQMEELRRERDAYIAFGEEVGRGTGGKEEGNEERLRLIQEIEELEKSAEAVTRELRAAEADRLKVEEELRALEEEEARLEEEETKFWQEHSTLQTTLSSLSSRRSSLLTSIAHDEALLSRLQHTNVYNDAFCIGHDGGFATINGLRLGRLPNAPATSSGGKGGNVDWIEINAAWGQTVLLLATLARKCGFQFEGYILHPRGNFSTIEKLPIPSPSSSNPHPTHSSIPPSNPSSTSAPPPTPTSTGEGGTTYELYGSGDWQIGRVFQSRRFDNGMVAFLECLRQLGQWAQARDAGLRLPHAINKDRIGEASIRLQFGSDEVWTRALRHVLLTLKVLLSWAVNTADDQEEGEGEG